MQTAYINTNQPKATTKEECTSTIFPNRGRLEEPSPGKANATRRDDRPNWKVITIRPGGVAGGRQTERHRRSVPY